MRRQIGDPHGDHAEHFSFPKRIWADVFERVGMSTTVADPTTVVLHVGGLQNASEQSVVEGVLGRRPGVICVQANPVAQTATVSFDPRRTSIVELQRWVRECGYHCAGRSVPGHVCDPLVD